MKITITTRTGRSKTFTTPAHKAHDELDAYAKGIIYEAYTMDKKGEHDSALRSINIKMQGPSSAEEVVKEIKKLLKERPQL